MDTEVPGCEILEIAEKIERNGAKFYRRAAGVCEDPSICALFVDLAQWEMRHVGVFREMKERLAKQNWGPPRLDRPGAGPSDSQLLAGMAVFAVHPDPEEELTGQESRADVLKLALEKEKDSIVYYSGLKNFVSNEAERTIVTDIIQEEMKHVRILMQSLAQLD